MYTGLISAYGFFAALAGRFLPEHNQANTTALAPDFSANASLSKAANP
jgi:hypothetical protein